MAYMYSSATLVFAALLAAGMAAPQWDTSKHVYTDSVAEGQFSAPRIRKCRCFLQFDPETNKTEFYCNENSDPRCRRLKPEDLTVVQEKALLHQAFASKVEETVKQCVCYLDVRGEANALDFSCSNPLCYQLLAKKEVASANNWPHFVCLPNEVHPTDACCRCSNGHWDCNMRKQLCRPLTCPTEQQITIAGDCCPGCLQGGRTPVQTSPSAQTNQGSSPDKVDDVLQSCECSVCKYSDDDTGDLQIKISKSNPECQCDFYLKFPYDDVVMCSAKERATAMKAYSDKLAKELADVAIWSG